MNRVKLFAPASYWKMPESERQQRYNGCGPDGFAFLIPDRIWGLDIRECCMIHDHAYEIGCTIAEKEEADRVFLNNMLRVIDANTDWWLLKKLRIAAAYRYYLACAKFGGPYFWADKNPDENLGWVGGRQKRRPFDW